MVSEIESHDQRAVALQLDVGDIKSFDGFIQQVSNTLKDKWGRDTFDFLINSAYASMKGAIETFTRYIAKELGQRGITANLVAPGAIETDFTKPAFDADPQRKEMIASLTALGRVGVPDDIGGVVAFLCSKDARWVNGQRLEASGGIFL